MIAQPARGWLEPGTQHAGVLMQVTEFMAGCERRSGNGTPPRVVLPAPPGAEEWIGARTVSLVQPGRIIFGNDGVVAFASLLPDLALQRVLVVTSEVVREACAGALQAVSAKVPEVTVFDAINTEPTVAMAESCLAAARAARVDGVIGIGGGSALDVAKLVAALAVSKQSVASVFGNGSVKGRSLFLACLPTTAGTGSEVSPNAILLDESHWAKHAVISPHLVPDVACVDPLLTHSVPPAITAATGVDALAHCLEAFANQFAHPAVDLYALEGIRLISQSLRTVVTNGRAADARARVALGSLYGGLCLGPVNTAAVHALAYPLASEFGISHGVSIALLLPHVLRFNRPSASARYARIAEALGVAPAATDTLMAERGVGWLATLIADLPVPQRLSECGIPRNALPRLATSALTVTRLLKNNPRPVTEADAVEIYEAAY